MGLHWACSERERSAGRTGRLKAASMWETESGAGVYKLCDAQSSVALLLMYPISSM